MAEATRRPASADPRRAARALLARHRFVGAAVFTVPLLVLYFWRDALSSEYLLPGLSMRAFVTWLLATPVQFGFGLRFYRSAFSAIRNGRRWRHPRAHLTRAVAPATRTPPAAGPPPSSTWGDARVLPVRRYRPTS